MVRRVPARLWHAVIDLGGASVLSRPTPGLETIWHIVVVQLVCHEMRAVHSQSQHLAAYCYL